MATVTGVDDGYVRCHMLGDEVGGATVGMTYNEHVGVHRFQCHQGVFQGLALLGGGGVDVQVQHVRGQALGGQFEGGEGVVLFSKNRLATVLPRSNGSF